MNRSFWNGKRVFLTGHTGFKGGWLSLWLLKMGAKVSGMALEPNTDPSFFQLTGLDKQMESCIGNIVERETLEKQIKKSNPDVVFHLAAQSLVLESYKHPVETFASNVMGTVNLLESCRKNSHTRSIVVVTSDKCYDNQESLWGHREGDALGGQEPYSASKACTELVTNAYRCSFFGENTSTGVASVRAGNVIGGGDWAENRLIPDAVRGLSTQRSFVVRNPQSIRPWQHVLEPLSGYLELAEKLYDENGNAPWNGAWNFGPLEDGGITVAVLADLVVSNWGEGSWEHVLQKDAKHESQTLRLDSTKARRILGWRSCLPLPDAVRFTMDWYRQALSGHSQREMFQFSHSQIEDYEMRQST